MVLPVDMDIDHLGEPEELVGPVGPEQLEGPVEPVELVEHVELEEIEELEVDSVFAVESVAIQVGPGSCIH